MSARPDGMDAVGGADGPGAPGPSAAGAPNDEQLEEWRALHRAGGRAVEARLVAAFAALRAPLAAPEPDERLTRRPAPEGWSALEVAEHVALASGFLLLLARKIAGRARRRAARGERWPTAPPEIALLAEVATDRRRWEHPPHMTPSGRLPPAAVAARLDGVLAEARALLAELPAGEGTLHRIRISALPGAPRLGLLQLLEFVARHAERHVRQQREALAAARPGERSDERGTLT